MVDAPSQRRDAVDPKQMDYFSDGFTVAGAEDDNRDAQAAMGK